MNKKDMKKDDDFWNKPFSKEEYEKYYKMKHKVKTTTKQIYEDFWFECNERLENREKDFEETIENTDFFEE